MGGHTPQCLLPIAPFCILSPDLLLGRGKNRIRIETLSVIVAVKNSNKERNLVCNDLAVCHR